ncbi:MAG: hypothetical protein WC356_06530 [Candidatus Micrarchaeia archaeon]|jgi:hypothetical protein
MNGKQQEYSEPFITKALTEHLEDRDRNWQELFGIHKTWLWSMFLITVVSVFFCALGVLFSINENRRLNEYMYEQSVLSQNRELREIAKAKQDSIAGARDDSLAKAYIKQMSRYEKMPYYKSGKGN